MLNLKKVVLAADLGDSRRNDRSLEIVAQIASGMMGARDEASGRAGAWAHAMGAMRLYDNPEVSLPGLYGMCKSALRELTSGASRCYVVHDISVVDYSGHNAKEDRVAVGDHRGAGYELYSALVLDDRGRPLGPVVQELRTKEGCLSSEREDPYRFVSHIAQVERGTTAAKDCLPGIELVHIEDREFDEIAKHRERVRLGHLFISRVHFQTRRVMWKGEEHLLRTVANKIRMVPVEKIERNGQEFDRFVGETVVTLHTNSWRKAHRRKFSAGKPGEPIELRLIRVQLRQSNKTKHEWLLLSNLPDSASLIGQIYVWRWRIERFFYLTKVGLKLEDWTQQDGWRVARRLALTMLAAMTIYQMLSAPDDPDILEAQKTVATFGGWLGRKRDPMGPIVLMRGITKLLSALLMIEQYGVKELRHLVDLLKLPTFKKT
jgi:hypothetical protein